MVPSTLRSKVQEAAKLLQGKLSGYQNQWESVAPKGVVAPLQIVGPKARQVYEHITGEKLPYSPGDVVTVKGQQVKITSVNPDGTFSGETL
jgi:glycine cleavage system aminomethyltransferase T